MLSFRSATKQSTDRYSVKSFFLGICEYYWSNCFAEHLNNEKWAMDSCPRNNNFVLHQTSFLKYLHGRRNCPEVFCKKGVLKNFGKFTGKYLCQIFFFKKVGPATLLKKKRWYCFFLCEFCEIFKNNFYYKTPSSLILIWKDFSISSANSYAINDGTRKEIQIY